MKELQSRLDDINFSTATREHRERVNILNIHMFGTFSLYYADGKIDCVSSRSKLIWNILAYLICNQGKLVRTEELIANVWNSSDNVNPTNAMRTAIFRARRMLDELTEGRGGKFLVSQNGGYMWNPELPTVIDCVEFDRLMTEIGKNPDDYGRMLAAFRLYEGKFLSQQSANLWVIPRQVYYHKLYESLLDRMLPLLEKEKNYFDAICVCRKMLLIDAFSERNYQNLMRFLLLNNERGEVIKVYKEMSQILLSGTGALPDFKSRFLYREALSGFSAEPLPIDEIVQKLRERDNVQGAYICDYDFFKTLYQAYARAMERTSLLVHIAVVSLRAYRKDVKINELSEAMDLFEDTVRYSLRRWDIVTRCSASQFIIMLLSADFKNSQQICERFVAAFRNSHPHCRYGVEYEVRAIRPEIQS